MQLVLGALLLLLSSSGRAAVSYVIAISIDGGRGDLMREFIETAPEEFPNLKRLRDQSAFTFNARCDYTDSITIPDHLCMLTGRPVRQPAGLPARIAHGIESDGPGPEDTVHQSSGNPGVYKVSIFDVTHDHGLSTAAYLGKERLAICVRSWDAAHGAPDRTGADNGRNKIDEALITEAAGGNATPAMLEKFAAEIAGGTLKNFTFFQIAETDYAGHTGGWTAAPGPYRDAMKDADGWIGRILDAVQGNAKLSGNVAIVLTADHGGGYPASVVHINAAAPANYTIPFFLSAPGIRGGSSLYDCFENRFDPGSARPSYAAARQPVRNGDLANVCAALLGLPDVPGSLMAPAFRERVR